MGLRYVQGLGERERALLEGAPPPYRDLADFARRTGVDRRALLALCEAGAFSSLGLDRRGALWAARGLLSSVRGGLDLAPPVAPAALPRFAALAEAEEVRWDYEKSLHSTRGHPMAPLRPGLDRLGIPSAAVLNTRGRPGRRVRARYVGVVICRQRPQTASGVTFMTLEDETGMVNLVVWRQVYERHETLARAASLIEVRGYLQLESGVVHLVAESLHEPDLEPGRERAAKRPGPAGAWPKSRDFH